ncbi:MAG: hypothetical protein Q7U47_01350 [Paludibacter sp.]|nr:hypothetical protein [Paludibacter sp.]
MNNTIKFIFVAGAGLAAWYIPTIMAASKLKFLISGFSVRSIQKNKLIANVQLRITNPTGVKLSMSKLAGNIILNNKMVGELANLNQVVINANSNYFINIAFAVDVLVIGKDLWKEIINNNLQNSVLTIRGAAIVNYKQLPFNLNYTIQDITA